MQVFLELDSTDAFSVTVCFKVKNLLVCFYQIGRVAHRAVEIQSHGVDLRDDHKVALSSALSHCHGDTI